MNKAKIFLVGESEKELVPMEQTPYEAETILQDLLVDYPDLIPGDQINPDSPRKWLLVKKEAGIPACEEGNNVWSLDHLFLDQEGIPTLVECKRASDTRIRREVVAQMLDYAANGTIYWPIDRLRQDATESAEAKGKTLAEMLFTLAGLSDEEEIESYWKMVETNLKSGKIRLVFIADEIPRELRRVVEFLNEKMTDVEVLAVEVKQYLGGGKKAVVPHVIGMTEAARQKKGGTTQKTTMGGFLSQHSEEGRAFFEHILETAQERGYTIYWGTKGFSIRAKYPASERLFSFVYGWPKDEFQFYMGYLELDEEKSSILRKKLLEFGIFQEAGSYTLKAFIRPDNKEKISKAFEVILQEIEKICQPS